VHDARQHRTRRSPEREAVRLAKGETNEGDNDEGSNTFGLISWCAALVVVLQPLHGRAQQNPDASKSSLDTLHRAGRATRFRLEIGTWKTHLRRLVHPLTVDDLVNMRALLGPTDLDMAAPI